ncbi:acetylcholinesterase-like [Littorina saxatilis]|uniref:Carboxylic ester hydrolase n=1 Tax=Littorina saxatilis TaxID=31220 RepID=A0AAN9ANT6_9CAEN
MEMDWLLTVVLVHLLAVLQELPAAVQAYGPIIDTDKGRVQGKTVFANDKKVDVFWGIPFAKPPLGDLRFKHPEQIDRWEGVFNATQPPASCMQGMDLVYSNFSGATLWNPNTKISEDCLYLNVWVPRTNPPYHHKAVLVWIYGGGFYSGTSTLAIYDGRYLAAENDIIVVSCNYRVGSLGFLNLNTPEARGNAGLMDQRLALEWVQRNIGYFGGSVHNVTIFGESAGAVSVGLHLLSSLSRGLFSRAILQSGAPQINWASYSADEGRQRSRRLAGVLDCNLDQSDTDIVECLRQVGPELFVVNDYSVVQGIVQFPFVPVVDGFFLTETPDEYLRSGRFKKTPLLLGSNAQEGTWFLVYENADNFNLHTESLISAENMELLMENLFFYHPRHPERLNKFGKEAIIFQYTDWEKPKDQASCRDHIALAVGDYHFVCEVNELSDRYAESGQRVYQYWFDHRSSISPWPEWMGTLHGDEIHYVFGMPLDADRGYSEKEKQLSKRIMRFWSNFAKTGDPNRGPGELSMQEWPEYRPFERQYLNISLDLLKHGWRPHHRAARARQCAFWHHYLPNLLAGTSDMSTMEKEWKQEFHEWKTRYIVDWKNQFDNFLNNYEKRLKTCGMP